MAEIKVKTKEHPTPVVVNYDLPTDLPGLMEKFGDEVVATYANRGITLAIQALVRTNIDTPKDEIQKMVDSWVPGTRIRGPQKSPIEKATALLGNMSADDLQALLAKVKAAQKGS